jgi:hypothetical protein
MAEFPWARIYRHGVNRGGGILLTSQLVVTAAHCVAEVCVGDPEDAICVSMGHDTTPVPASLVERVATKDLALLKPSQPLGSSVRLPWASRCRRGDEWFAPSRPTLSDPQLDGSVSGTMNYECVAGGVLHALQLTTRSSLGNYEGYSGGPVFLEPEEANKVIGILIEQYPDRAELDRATNTLFAAAIEGVIEQFDTLSTSYLLRSLFEHAENRDSARLEPIPLDEPGPADLTVAERVASTVLGWSGAVDVVDPEIRSVHQALVSKWVTQHTDEAGDV